jgi:hypothetical protein
MILQGNRGNRGNIPSKAPPKRYPGVKASTTWQSGIPSVVVAVLGQREEHRF